MIHVVDTHAYLWFITGNTRLGQDARAILNDATSHLVIPATAYAEACWIVEHGRIAGLTVVDVQTALDADPRFTIYPLSRAVIDRSNGLAAIGGMHDRQIVATALLLTTPVHPVALVTHDQNITDSGLLPIVW